MNYNFSGVNNNSENCLLETQEQGKDISKTW